MIQKNQDKIEKIKQIAKERKGGNRIMKNLQEYVINVYEGNGGIYQNGTIHKNEGVVYFLDSNVSTGMKGNSFYLAKVIADSLKDNLRKNSKIKLIRFEFPACERNIPMIIRDYFGRPPLYFGAIFLKPLNKEMKEGLIKEINKISNIQDKGGNLIKLVV